MPAIADQFADFKLGADPEFFLYDQEKEKIVSAHKYLEGTKEEPEKVKGGAIQVDGIAAEINIDPASSCQEWLTNIAAVKTAVRKRLPTNITISNAQMAVFSKEEWDEIPPLNRELGCSPDMNAWTGMVNPPPNTDGMETTRFPGGHIHFGWTEDASPADMDHVRNCFDLVKQLDYYVGMWGRLHDNSSAVKRREMYGQAGACRIKPYGVEYRVPSGFWLHSKSNCINVWNRSMAALNMMANKYHPKTMPAGFNDLVIRSINTSRIEPSVSDYYFPFHELALEELPGYDVD